MWQKYSVQERKCLYFSYLFAFFEPVTDGYPSKQVKSSDKISIGNVPFFTVFFLGGALGHWCIGFKKPTVNDLIIQQAPHLEWAGMPRWLGLTEKRWHHKNFKRKLNKIVSHNCFFLCFICIEINRNEKCKLINLFTEIFIIVHIAKIWNSFVVNYSYWTNTVANIVNKNIFSVDPFVTIIIIIYYSGCSNYFLIVQHIFFSLQYIVLHCKGENYRFFWGGE